MATILIQEMICSSKQKPELRELKAYQAEIAPRRNEKLLFSKGVETYEVLDVYHEFTKHASRVKMIRVIVKRI